MTRRDTLRIILDTNLWSSIGDEMIRESFDSFAAVRSLRIVVPPSILLEVAKIPKADARQRIIAAITLGARERLDTEAKSESAEVASAAKRIRPHWMLNVPDIAKIRALDEFWTNRIWKKALRDSQWIYDFQTRKKNYVRQIAEEQRAQRKTFQEDGFNPRPLTGLLATGNPSVPESMLVGWDGTPVELWRAVTRNRYWHELAIIAGRSILTKEHSTLADWVGAYVDLPRLRSNPEDFTKFWLEDVYLEEMPRNWLRFSVEVMQTAYKINDSNPLDVQHSTYMLDCDLFLSADRRYVETLNTVREDTPFSIAEPRLVSGDRSFPIIERIAAVL